MDGEKVGYKSYLVSFEVEHDGCFTRAIGNKYMRVLRIDVESASDRSILLKILSILAGEGLGSFLGFLKSYRGIYDTKLHSFSNNVAVVSFKYLRRGNGIISLINRLNGFLISLEALDGIEIWRLILPRARKDHIEALKERAESMGNMERFYATELRPDNLVDLYPQLSENEKRVLFQAYVLGYFDYPRRAGIIDVARALNISPATFLYHLRKAEKKLIASYIERKDLFQKPTDSNKAFK